MACNEKLKLLKTYRKLTEAYAAVVAKLHENMGTMPKAEYDSLYTASEALHADVTRAQSDYNSHVVAHGC